MRKTKRGKLTADILCYLTGAALYAFAICSFIKPNLLVTGGFSGLSIIINKLTGFPIGTLVFILNIPLFIIGKKLLGKGFILRSAAATAAVSLFIDLTEPYLPKIQADSILACIAGGIISGGALALIFIRGGSTGGADIISKLINFKFPHLPVGRIIMFCDIFVVTLSAVIFKNYEKALYSALMIAISSAAVDYLIYGSKSGKLLLAITNKGEEISKMVNSLGSRGATIVPVVGAYTGHNSSMLMIAVRASEIGKIYNIINSCDDNAFITLLDARVIIGRGFESKI